MAETWRRGGDSNPRYPFRGTHDFQSCTLNRARSPLPCYFKHLRVPPYPVSLPMSPKCLHSILRPPRLPGYFTRKTPTRARNIVSNVFWWCSSSNLTPIHQKQKRTARARDSRARYRIGSPVRPKNFCLVRNLVGHVSTMSPCRGNS